MSVAYLAKSSIFRTPLYSISNNILGKEVQGLKIYYIMDTCFEAADHVYFL